MFFVSSSFFPVGQKRKTCSSYKNTSKKSCHSTSVRSKQIPPSKTKLTPTKLGQIFAFRLDAVLVAGGLFDVILSMAGGGNDGVTLRFVSAMRLGLSRDVFRAQLFSTGKHGKIQRFWILFFFWGWIWQKCCFIDGVMCWCRYMYKRIYLDMQWFYIIMCAKVHNCVCFSFWAGMNVGIEWWMYVIRHWGVLQYFEMKTDSNS